MFQTQKFRINSKIESNKLDKEMQKSRENWLINALGEYFL